MNILFLDDNPKRVKAFRSEVPFAKIAYNAPDMIKLIKDQDEPIDFCFLDHDLGGEVYVDSNREDTGAEVARWISAKKPDINVVIVHTYNPEGAAIMTSVIKKAGYEHVEYFPFMSENFVRILGQLEQ